MRRRRQIDVPSVMLWRLLDQSLAARRSLKWPPPSLLLALQLLVIVLVALALAQPLLGTQRDSPQHTIYVLDASGSMRATDQSPSRFDAALRRLGEFVDVAGAPSGRISVVTA